MRLLLVRCRCPLCDLSYVREIPDWQHRNYEKVYKTNQNNLLVPCDKCRRADLKKLADKI